MMLMKMRLNKKGKIQEGMSEFLPKFQNEPVFFCSMYVKHLNSYRL